MYTGLLLESCNSCYFFLPKQVQNLDDNKSDDDDDCDGDGDDDVWGRKRCFNDGSTMVWNFEPAWVTKIGIAAIAFFFCRFRPPHVE